MDPICEAISFSLVCKVAMKIYQFSAQFSETKKTLKVVGEDVKFIGDGLLNCSQTADVNSPSVNLALYCINERLHEIMEVMEKAERMNVVLFCIRAKGIADELGKILGRIHLSMTTLNMGQNQQLCQGQRQQRLDLEQAYTRAEEGDRKRLNELKAFLNERDVQSRNARLTELTGIKTPTELAEVIHELESERRANEKLHDAKKELEDELMEKVIAALTLQDTAQAIGGPSPSKAHEDFKLCPITFEVMDDPVIIDFDGCGRTCNRSSFNQWLCLGNTSCPICQHELSSMETKPNVELREAIAFFRHSEPSNSDHSISFTLSTQGQGTYTGPVHAGRPHGTGRWIGVDGSEYEGGFKNGKMNGYGLFRWPKEYGNDQYYGEYKEDKKHGQGVFKWASGAEYSGRWANDKFNGRGVYIDEAGNKYDGEYQDGHRHGQGVFVWKGTGYKYDGQWKNDERHGNGAFRDGNGDLWKGTWEKGKRRKCWKDNSELQPNATGHEKVAAEASSNATDKSKDMIRRDSGSSECYV